MLKARKIETSFTVAQLGSRHRRVVSASGAGGSNEVSIFSSSPAAGGEALCKFPSPGVAPFDLASTSADLAAAPVRIGAGAAVPFGQFPGEADASCAEHAGGVAIPPRAVSVKANRFPRLQGAIWRRAAVQSPATAGRKRVRISSRARSSGPGRVQPAAFS